MPDIIAQSAAGRALRRPSCQLHEMFGHSWAAGAGALKPGQDFGTLVARSLGAKKIIRRGHGAAIAHHATVGGAGDGGWPSVLNLSQSISAAGSKQSPFGPGNTNGYAPRHNIIGSCFAQNSIGALGTNTRPLVEAMRSIWSHLCSSRIYIQSSDTTQVVEAGTWSNSSYGQQMSWSNSIRETTSTAATVAFTPESDLPTGRVIGVPIVVKPTDDYVLVFKRGATTVKTVTVKGSEIVDPAASYTGRTFNGNLFTVRLGVPGDSYQWAAGDTLTVQATTITTGALRMGRFQIEADPLDGPFIWELLPVNLPSAGYAFYAANGYAQGGAMNDAVMAAHRTALAAALAEFGAARTAAVDISDIPTATLFGPADSIHAKPEAHPLIARRIVEAVLPRLTPRICTGMVAQPKAFYYALSGTGPWGISGLVAATFQNSWARYGITNDQYFDIYPGFYLDLDTNEMRFRGRIIGGASGTVAFSMHPFNRAVGGSFVLAAGLDDVWTIPATTATGGTFTITLDGATTAAIAYNASNATLAAALNALSGWSRSSVTGATVVGTPAAGFTVTSQFHKGGKPHTLSIDTSGLTGGTTGAPVHTTTGALKAAHAETLNGTGSTDLYINHDGASWVDLTGLVLPIDL